MNKQDGDIIALFQVQLPRALIRTIKHLAIDLDKSTSGVVGLLLLEALEARDIAVDASVRAQAIAPSSEGTQPRARTQWTDEEDAMILDLRYSYDDIARMTERTRKAITVRAAAMKRQGHDVPHRWRPAG